MSVCIGGRMPAPLRFDLNQKPAHGATAAAVLLATVDDDGTPRIAILSPGEIEAPDDAQLLIDIGAESTTCKNLNERGAAAIWCVLDAAAYTIKGRVTEIDDGHRPNFRRVKFSVVSVWMDFDAAGPLVSGPTYRVNKAE